jgi:hypothetical protein
MYSGTPLLRPPRKRSKSGLKKGVVSHEGFILVNKCTKLCFENMVLKEGWSLMREVAHQGFHCI